MEKTSHQLSPPLLVNKLTVDFEINLLDGFIAQVKTVRTHPSIPRHPQIENVSPPSNSSVKPTACFAFCLIQFLKK